MKCDINYFDCIVFHYSIVIKNVNYIDSGLLEKLKSFSGLGIIIQDEMRWVNDTSSRIKELNIKTVFTVLNKDVIRKIYTDPWFDDVRFEQTLTGFVPEELLGIPLKPYEERRLMYPIGLGSCRHGVGVLPKKNGK